MLHRRVICQPYNFELIRCRQLKFCCFLSKINILALARSSEIHILIYFDLKSRFFNLCAAWNEDFACFQVKSTALPSGLNVKSTSVLTCFDLKSRFLSYNALREIKTLLV